MEEGCAFAPVEWGLGGKNGHVVKNLEYDVGDIHVAVVARGYGYGCGCCYGCYCGGGGRNFQRVSMLILWRRGGCSVLVV